MSDRINLRARLLSLDKDLEGKIVLEYYEDGFVVCEEGLIVEVLSADDYFAKMPSGVSYEDLRPHLLVPGFIDNHVHMPQQDIIAGRSGELLDWLDRHAFPAELRYADHDFARIKAETFINELFSAGTTCAQVFSTVHRHACKSLFVAASAKKMCLVAGKVMMDRNAPVNLLQNAADCREDTESLIEEWHGRGRLRYALTPRFAVTSSEEQLSYCSDLLSHHLDLYVQTHISENLEEIDAVRSLFPQQKDYLEVYEQAGLATTKSTFAHGIHLSKDERQRLFLADSKIAFCPSSNLFLGSGLLDIESIPDANLSIGSDVGGGTGLSMLHTCAEGFKVAHLAGYDWHPFEALWSITKGNADALGLGNSIGQLRPGFFADMVLLDLDQPRALKNRLEHCENLPDELFALMFLGDDRSIARTYVAGEVVFDRMELS